MSNNTSKEAILDALRRNTKAVFERPDLSELKRSALTCPDPVARFREVMREVGGRAEVLAAGDTPGAMIARLYPGARRIANTVPGLPGIEALPAEPFDPADAADAATLNGTDLAILASPLGVCENGCCWIARHKGYRAINFIAEELVILLPREALVPNMHVAYDRLPDDPSLDYGCFISGPSKTADIEQALVMGAHGAREVTVILT